MKEKKEKSIRGKKIEGKMERKKIEKYKEREIWWEKKRDGEEKVSRRT